MRAGLLLPARSSRGPILLHPLADGLPRSSGHPATAASHLSHSAFDSPDCVADSSTSLFREMREVPSQSHHFSLEFLEPMFRAFPSEFEDMG
jgi:hypothetical protein